MTNLVRDLGLITTKYILSVNSLRRVLGWAHPPDVHVKLKLLLNPLSVLGLRYLCLMNDKSRVGITYKVIILLVVDCCFFYENFVSCR